MRKPVNTTRSVNGVMQIVKEDQPPFKFANGTLQVNEEEIKEIRKKRGYGSLYEELPQAVEKVAKNKSSKKEDKDADVDAEKEKEGEDAGKEEVENTEEPKEDNIEVTVVEEVKTFNDASNYLKDKWGLDHAEVNSKAKIQAQAEKLKLDFPNYDVE